MSEDERFVREHWEKVHDNGDGIWIVAEEIYKFESGSAARRFTEERLEQIRQVEHEIQYLNFRVMVPELIILERILAREQAALDSLRRGMKLPAAQTATE